MFYKFRLQPLNGHDSILEFEWNPDSGQVRGTGARKVKELASQAAKTGRLVGHPHPTEFEIRDPLRQPAVLAVVLGAFWQLDGVLAKVYPSVARDAGPAEVLPDGTERPLGMQVLNQVPGAYDPR